MIESINVPTWWPAILAIIVAVIIVVFVAPKPWTPRRAWLRRSVISASIVILTVVIITGVAFALIPANNLDRFWRTVPLGLCLTGILGVLFAVGMVGRLTLLERYSQLIRHVSQKLTKSSRH